MPTTVPSGAFWAALNWKRDAVMLWTLTVTVANADSQLPAPVLVTCTTSA